MLISSNNSAVSTHPAASFLSDFPAQIPRVDGVAIAWTAEQVAELAKLPLERFNEIASVAVAWHQILEMDAEYEDTHRVAAYYLALALQEARALREQGEAPRLESGC